MDNDSMIISNPFRILNNNTGELVRRGGFGVVAARAGVGKTAMLVQLALNTMLKHQNVLHISLNEPVTKVSLWYKEIFNNLSEQNNIHDTGRMWESILPHRFIMTFKVEGFSVPKLEERLTDLSEQNIFSPDMVIIDGLPFAEYMRGPMTDLKRLAEKYSTAIWFTVTTHRHEETADNGIPPQIKSIEDLFDLIIQLKPEGRMINVFSLKGHHEVFNETPLVFDPFTMILKEKADS